MQLTVTLPDMLPHEQLAVFMKEIEQVFRREGISCEIQQEETAQTEDTWGQFDIEQIAVDTGISDFAQQHDHYLYGTPKHV